MEALQCKDEIVQSNDEAMNLIPEQNRILKRNIGELAIDGKLNGMKKTLDFFIN